MTVIALNSPNIYYVNDAANADSDAHPEVVHCASYAALMRLKPGAYRYFAIGNGNQISPEEFGTFVEQRLAPQAQGSEIMNHVSLFGPSAVVRRFRQAALNRR
jgi:hypothetical protein